MRTVFTRQLIISLAIVLMLGLCFDEASAQRRRPRRSRRVTNPVATRPLESRVPVTSTQGTEPQIISTAEEQAAEQNNTPEVSGQIPATPRRGATRRRASDPEDDDAMRRTVNELSSQVTKLSDKLTQMEQQQRTLVDMERLSRAEVRAENLRTQLRDVQEKEGALQARLEQIEYSLKPENIERSVSISGSTRPEEARETRRVMLENDKTRARTQLDLYVTSRQRLESAIVNADLEVDRLRKRLEEADDSQPKTPVTDETDTSGTTTDEEVPPRETTSPGTSSSTPPR